MSSSDPADRIIYKGLDYVHGDATFIQGRAGLIQASEALYGGAWNTTIRNVMAGRGIGAYALSVSVSGPWSLPFKEWGTFTANVTGGSGTISYQWYKKDDGSSYWINLGTSESQRVRMNVTGFTMKVLVTRGSETDQDTKYCRYEGNGGWKVMVVNLPDSYALSQNLPNPFNPVTTIKYDLPEWSFIELKVYDLTGRKIRTLVNGNEEVGYRSVLWDGKDKNGKQVPAGVYIYHLEALSTETAKRFSVSRKMVLIK